MDRTINIRHFLDEQGNPVAPFSPEAAIYDESGKRLSDKLKGLNLNSIREAQDEALSAIDEKENEAIGNFSSQRVIPDMLSPEVMALIETSGGGTINNMPDGEDLTSKDIAGGKSVMQLADRPYNPSAFSGKGYTILRKNVSALSRGGSSNILTQEMISQPNTVFEVRYDFDLNGAEITVPEGCILRFLGGSFKNGSINFNRNSIQAYSYKIFENLNFKGIVISPFNCEWFGANENRLDNDVPINYAITSINSLTTGGTLLLRGRYIISDTVYIRPGVSIDGISSSDSFNKAIPQDDNYGSAILYNFTDSKKWVIDSYVTENSEQIKYEYNRLHISTKEWGKNRNGGGYIKNIAIQKYSRCSLDYIFGGIRISQIYFSELSNIYIYDVAVGLCLNNSWGTLLYKSHIVGFYCGIYAGYLVTDFRIAYSTIDRTYYSKETFYIPDEIIGAILFNDRAKLLPTYTDVKSCALLVESSGTDSSKVGVYNSIIQGFDAVACMSSGYIISQDLYLEGIKKTIAWTYNGNINFKTTIYPVAKTESFTFGTITGQIVARQVQFCTCYIDESNTVSQDILYRIIPLDRSVLWYDSYTINEEGKVEEMKHCDKKEIVSDDCNVMYCGAEIGGEIYDDTYRYILHTGLSSNSPTYFSEIIKRGFNNKTIIITQGNTDISARGMLLEGKNFYFKTSKRNGSATVLPQSSPIKLKDCNISIEHNLKTNGRFLEKTDNEIIATDEIQYSFEVSGKCVIRTIGYVGYDEGNAGYKLIKLVGTKPIEADIHVNANYVDANKILFNPDFQYEYIVRVIKPDGTRNIFTNLKRMGTYSEKPSSSIITEGYSYYCTDRKSTEGNRNGIMIYYAGADTWVDALGRVVE